MNIKSVARLSGLSAHTLRAWEKRYQVIQPERSEGGRRLYSMEDVEKLKLLALLVDRGHAIGTIAKLTTAELNDLSAQLPGPTPSLPPSGMELVRSAEDLLQHHRKGLIASLNRLDFDEIDRLILRARMDVPVRAFILDIVSPLLSEVGELVAESKLDIAQEHALSALLRNHLGELLSLVQKASPWNPNTKEELPSFIFATAEGDLHEFGILLAALLTGSKGLSFRYLGPNMPAASLAKAATTTSARIVVVGSVEAAPERLAQPLEEYVGLLFSQFKKSSYRDVSIWIGGYCDFDPDSHRGSGKLLHVDTLSAFDRELDRILGQARGPRSPG